MSIVMMELPSVDQGAASNGNESLSMNGLAPFLTQPNTYNYSTGFRDSSVEETTTNSGYYEDILDEDPHGHSTTRGDTGRNVVTGNGKGSVMRVLPNVDQGAAYESIDDAMLTARQATNTDCVTYDDVTEETPHNVSGDKPVHVINDPVSLMTPADETVVIDNCIYEGGGQ